MKLEPEPESTLALSFLDTLSCGLGGAIALFMVFIVMPHQGQTPTGLANNTKGDAFDIRASGLVDPNAIKSKFATTMVTIKFSSISTWHDLQSGQTAKEWIETNVVINGIEPMQRVKANSPPEKSYFEDNDLVGIRLMIPGGQRVGKNIFIRIPPSSVVRTVSIQVFVGGEFWSATHGDTKENEDALIEIDFSKQDKFNFRNFEERGFA